MLGILKSYRVSRYSNSVSSLFAMLSSLLSILYYLIVVHTIQRKSLSHFKQNFCWIIISDEISQISTPLVACNAWLPCHCSTPLGQAGRAGPSATFHSREHAPWLADKKARESRRPVPVSGLLCYWTHLQRNTLVRLPDCIFSSIGPSLDWMLTGHWKIEHPDIAQSLDWMLIDQTSRYWTITWKWTELERSNIQILDNHLIGC